MTQQQASIGIFGGSGFYEFLKDAREVSINTPYGKPSDNIVIGDLAGRSIAFLPRHGKDHRYPPHKVPYQANLYAFKRLGIERVIAPCAVGSLRADIEPGHFVLCDQFVDRTRNRADTFYETFLDEGPRHLSLHEPYCAEGRDIAGYACEKLKIPVHKQGTLVVINGPRFSTKAESRWFSSQGWDVIGMTGYPEVVLARELGMCYMNISLVTDHDVGLEGRDDIRPVTNEQVLKVFNENIDKVKELIFEIIRDLPYERSCECGKG